MGIVRVAVDAMGGDRAPSVVIDGTLDALAANPDAVFLLVGPREVIEEQLSSHTYDQDRLKIVHASEAVGMDESPVEALRRKPDSSIRIMTGLLKEGHCDSIFSAGNTGAMVAAATMGLGLLPGVRRAGILVSFKLGERPVALIDAGANMQCKPEHLLHYAVMASQFSRCVYKIDDPSVGLLSVGEEELKGNRLVKETKDLLRDESSVRFIGNVEGGDIFTGECDVVVCEGFVGNIVLKVSEGLSEKLIGMLKSRVATIDDLTGHSGPVHDSLTSLSSMVDYAEYGGAPLLGINGNVIIGHGRSSKRAITSALAQAADMVRSGLRESIIEAVKPA